MPENLSTAADLKQAKARQHTSRKGIRRFAPFTIQRKSHSWQVQIHWTWLPIWAAAIAIIGWIGIGSGAYFFVKYERGFTDVKYTDMLLLPLRWKEVQSARGDFLIKEAQKDLERQKYREAFSALRVGLIKSPANKEGRLLLAQFYGLWKRPDLTRQTLIDGFAYHQKDKDYLKTLLSFLIQQQEDQKVISIYKTLLAEDPAINERNQIVALAAASSCYHRGNYDEAEAILHRYQLERSRDGRLLTARINWDLGAKDQAIELLRGLAADLPNDDEVYAQTVAYLREAGRDSEARRESFMRALANPRNFRARIDQLYAYQKEGDTASLKENVEEIFHDFASDPKILLALADFAANSGDPALAHRIYDYTKAHNLSWEGAAFMTVEAHIVAKQYQAALEMIRQLQKDNPDWNKRYYSVFNGLQAIAQYGLGDPEAAQLSLNNFLGQSTVRADNLIAVSKRLLVVGAKLQARQVLDQAAQADPLNQAALTSLVKLDLELNNTPPLAANTRKLLAMRKPSQDVLRSVYRKLGSDLFLFSPDRTALLQELRASITGSTSAAQSGS